MKKGPLDRASAVMVAAAVLRGALARRKRRGQQPEGQWSSREAPRAAASAT
ncbi:hypothetical protein OG216_11290 [Streptomycetaceae bacterium NBC_01309]